MIDDTSYKSIEKGGARAIAVLITKTLVVFLVPLGLVVLLPVLGFAVIALLLASMVSVLLIVCVRVRHIDEANRALYEAMEAICLSTGDDYGEMAGSMMLPCHELERHRVLFDLSLSDSPEAAALVRDNSEALERELVDRLPEFDKAACVQMDHTHFCVECWDSSKTSQSLYVKHVEKPQSIWDDPDAYMSRHAEDAD